MGSREKLCVVVCLSRGLQRQVRGRLFRLLRGSLLPQMQVGWDGGVLTSRLSCRTQDAGRRIGAHTARCNGPTMRLRSETVASRNALAASLTWTQIYVSRGHWLSQMRPCLRTIALAAGENVAGWPACSHWCDSAVTRVQLVAGCLNAPDRPQTEPCVWPLA